MSKLKSKDIAGKTFFVRIDLNVDAASPADMFRLDAIIPTFKLLLRSGARIVTASHRGRPETYSTAESLAVFAPLISKRVGADVDFISAYRIGAAVKAIRASDASIILMENMRFFRGETENDPSFARALASCADMYVNDAFPVSHRKAASVSAITKFLPSYAGLRVESELCHLDAAMKRVKHPFTLVIGGAKTSDKIGVIDYFKNKADAILLGGGPANTFFAAKGVSVGSSLYDEGAVKIAKKNLLLGSLYLPSDTITSSGKILDVGLKTSNEYRKIILASNSVVWNGPLGLFQKERFARGTLAMWRAVMELAKRKPDALIVIGGGETVASMALLKTRRKLPENIFISTGGGAMLEYLSGKKLPGISALQNAK
ncbi:phosphoglycerate kinase [Candidatus Jorgensenbacteria bacterium RIFCSPLOWO2_02_FULL_45_12]|uniref:Phosphoglycerate kinase n=1 Tax=Candidatus Jorgensenbacteria bacterium RIFCSPHIGHO2_02_FULL_45_20 TaxID=1798470 RepID=A0A1F6BMQ2_9BACT|nr:MAG: phosphoglycerate kinase [Candidatus Jorgensenbacteria bacterium RIFCSPHIGHO2_02_FULL_45_20]OGG42244.1 MAG: phosphoglycerate kinase [Candidatus Jorgensenbacteria bacterium RIFCSPLOWO2_02_FULL_45_12]